MSKPAPGDYYIVNASYGAHLAVSYSSRGGPLLYVSEKGEHVVQVWTIRDQGDGQTQTISPPGGAAYQVASGSGSFLTILPAAGYVWNINELGDGNYIIKDGTSTYYWGLQKGYGGERVTQDTAPSDDGTRLEQRWLLLPAEPL